MEMREKRYSAFDIYSTPLGKAQSLAHSKRSGKTKLLSHSQVQLLHSCDDFKSLRDHAVAFCRQNRWRQFKNVHARRPSALRARLVAWMLKTLKDGDVEMPVSAREVEAVERQLSAFTGEGFLVSYEEICATIETSCASVPQAAPNTITTVGIPTRSRPACLKRALTGYVENGKKYGRTTSFVVVDDSGSSQDKVKNQQLLHHLKSRFGADMFYVDRQRRAEFAHLLARQADLPAEVVRFALLGDARCTMTNGASRNALLIHAVGDVSMQVDDDTICTLGPAPERRRGLSLSSASEINELWFFATRAHALAKVSPLELDFLGVHEQMLGKSPECCILEMLERDEELHIDEMSSNFLRTLENDRAVVSITQMGAAGDSGLHQYHNVSRLFLKGASFERLAGGGSDYRMKLNTREIVRAPTRFCIAQGGPCVAMSLGLDTRALLPPFMPVQRNSDGLFSAIINLCFSKALKGYLPYLLSHDPPQVRSHAVTLGSDDTAIVPPRTADLVKWLVYACRPSMNFGSEAESISALGQSLKGLGSLQLANFEEMVRGVGLNMANRHMQEIERSLDRNADAPDLWKSDVKRYASAYQEHITRKFFFLPIDLDGSPEERMRLFQELVYQYGRLLMFWPAIVQAAFDLSWQGKRLALPI